MGLPISNPLTESNIFLFFSSNNIISNFFGGTISSEVSKNQQVQTRYLQNAAYMRLKNLQLGYTIPHSIVNKISLQRIRLYISGENLFTITGLNKNFDPETLSGWGGGMGKSYPITKSLAFGLNIDF